MLRRIPVLSPEVQRMTPLRQRFIEDLQVRNYAASTIESYTYHRKGRGSRVEGRGSRARFAVRAVSIGSRPSTLDSWLSNALRFLYRITLPRDWPVTMIPFGKKPKTLPRPTYRSVPAWAAKTWPACSHVYRRPITA